MTLLLTDPVHIKQIQKRCKSSASTAECCSCCICYVNKKILWLKKTAHIVKKSKKWECKICGTKQSLKRNYGKGSGKDCRIQVMRLNELRLTKNNSMESEIFDETFTKDVNDQQVTEQSQIKKPLSSKWEEYLEENTVSRESDSDECATDYFFNSNEKMKKRMKKKLENNNLKKKKICTESKKNKVLFQENEETVKKDELLSSLISQSFESYEKKEQEIKKGCPIQYKSELKPNKYAKYLDEEENENNVKEVKKTTSIFDSDLTDLDSLF